MATQALFTAVKALPLVLVLLELTRAAEKTDYFKLGGSLELTPTQPSERISSVSWKHNGDLVAEWVDGKVDLMFYGVLQNRATMDKTTAVLNITNMTSKNAGVYTVEINDRLLGDEYKAVSLKEVSTVEVVVRPLICSASDKACNLNCHSDLSEVGPVIYHWKLGERAWVEGEQDREISNNKEEEQPETFSCRIKNPVSEKDSPPLKNPFLTKEEPGSNVGLIVGLFFGLLLLVGVVVVLLMYLLRDTAPFSGGWAWLMNLMSLMRRDPATAQSNGTATHGSGSREDSAAAETMLNTNSP